MTYAITYILISIIIGEVYALAMIRYKEGK